MGKTIDIEANSLLEAVGHIPQRIPENLFLTSIAIISQGKMMVTQGRAKTTQEAYNLVTNEIPKNVIIVNKEEVNPPTTSKLIVEAENEMNARWEVLKKITLQDGESIKSLNLKTSGSKGFLKKGKKLNQYEAEIFKEANVRVVYQERARIRIEIDEMENLKMKMRNAESYYLMNSWGGIDFNRSPIVKNSIIKDPLGIAVDSASNFYVTGHDVISAGEN